MSGEIAALQERIASAWNKAEHAIKIAEQVNSQVVNPAIYELRYAGRRIMESWQHIKSGDEAQALYVLRDAEMDCMRARHDAIDAATSKIIVHLELAVKKLGATRVLSCFPNWGDCYHHLCEVRSKIAVSREKRDDREAIYSTIEAADLPKIVKLYNEFRTQEPDLVREVQWLRIGATASFLIGIVGIGLGAASLF